MKTPLNQKGFTLIESLLYIALFTIIIGGGLLSAYQIIQSADGSYNHIILQQEANFLFRKITWALTGATSFNETASTLTISKPMNGTTAQLIFKLDGGDVTLESGQPDPVILNASSIAVSDGSFSKSAGVNGQPDSVTINFTLTADQNGKPARQGFSFMKYLRK